VLRSIGCSPPCRCATGFLAADGDAGLAVLVWAATRERARDETLEKGQQREETKSAIANAKRGRNENWRTAGVIACLVLLVG